MKKILIVDDEDKIRELIRVNLEIVGYNCDEAYDEYCNDYNLSIDVLGNNVTVNKEIGEMFVSNASNQYTVVQ